MNMLEDPKVPKQVINIQVTRSLSTGYWSLGGHIAAGCLLTVCMLSALREHNVIDKDVLLRSMMMQLNV
jgi:hypothetical protein